MLPARLRCAQFPRPTTEEDFGVAERCQLDTNAGDASTVFSGQRQRSLSRHTSQRGLRARQV